MPPSKCLFIVLDGLGDRQYPELDGLTPLQAAPTPNLDRLASLGGNGLYHAGTLGEPLPSENAHFALFGYPQSVFPGRGPLEALGSGLDLRPGQVAVLAHFVSARDRDGGLFVKHDRPSQVSSEEMQDLFKSVGRFTHQGIEIKLEQTAGLFGVLLVHGEVDPLITDSNPMRDQAFASDVLPLCEAQEDPRSQATAEALRAYLRWSFHRLDRSQLNAARRQRGVAPVNALVTQRAGRLGHIPSFSEYIGLKGASIASGAMFRGLASYIGLQTYQVQSRESVQADLAARLELGCALLSEYDFIHVHTKAPDEAAHSKDCCAKRNAVAALDRALAAYMPRLSGDPDLLTVVVSDHSTPSSGPMVHSGEPVPMIMRGTTIRRDQVEKFDEIKAASGTLGLIRETELMRLVLNALDRAKMRGIRETARQGLSWPGRYPVLDLK